MNGMFIGVMVNLARAESSILHFDEEEGRCLWGVTRWVDFSGGKVFIKEVFGSFSLIWEERVHFSYLWGKGIIQVDLMIIGPGGGNMVSSFF